MSLQKRIHPIFVKSRRIENERIICLKLIWRTITRLLNLLYQLLQEKEILNCFCDHSEDHKRFGTLCRKLKMLKQFVVTKLRTGPCQIQDKEDWAKKIPA